MLADLLVPVPSGASNIRNLLSWGESALSVVEIVALVATEASASFIKGVALIGNRHTDVVAVEDPVVGALKTSLLVPVPGGASDIGNLLNGGEDALSVVQVIANITAEAGSVAIKGVALIRNGNTDFVSIEYPVV